MKDRETGDIVAMDNKALRKAKGIARFSRQQYEISKDGFYDRMQGLVNPRPLDPVAMQTSLVDALDEAVARRMNSVNNAVEFQSGRGWKTIDMPTGYSVFETTGPWEDFSTPARDMRLLISIDTVLAFAGKVKAAPERYGLRPEQAEQTSKDIAEKRDAALAAKSMEYTKSDGSKAKLSLKEIVDRRKRFEMSYNPNDCTEVRWAAPPTSAEMKSCNRRAPAAHTARMKKYRAWFIDRQRPPR